MKKIFYSEKQGFKPIHTERSLKQKLQQRGTLQKSRETQFLIDFILIRSLSVFHQKLSLLFANEDSR